MKLYELSAQYTALSELFGAEEMDEQAITDTLESLSGEIAEKADGIACIIKESLSEAEILKREADTLLKRAKAKKSKADWLTGYLYQQLKAIGIRKIETIHNVIKIKKTPPSVKIADETAFIAWATMAHEEFICQKAPEVDKVAVKKAVAQGQEIPGVTLESGETLSIK